MQCLEKERFPLGQSPENEKKIDYVVFTISYSCNMRGSKNFFGGGGSEG